MNTSWSDPSKSGDLESQRPQQVGRTKRPNHRNPTNRFNSRTHCFLHFVTCPEEKNGFHCTNKACLKKMNAHRLPLTLWPKTWLHQTQLEDLKAPAAQNPLIGGLMMRCLKNGG